MRRIHTVIPSANAADDTCKRSLQGGAIAFLPTPAAEEALLAAMKAALASWPADVRYCAEQAGKDGKDGNDDQHVGSIMIHP